MTTFKNLVALAILLGCSATASAQFGGLVKKVKKAATEKVESKVKEAKKEAKQKVESKVEGKVNETAGIEEKKGYDPNRKYKPSKEALAADPQLNDTTVEKGFTKSIGEIHACYEQFSDVTLYTPYYTDDAKRFYGIKDVTNSDLYYIFYSTFSEALQKDFRTGYYYNKYTPVNLANDQIQVPCDEFVVNAWTCRFIADPKSETALKEYIFANTWVYSPNVVATRHYAMKDKLAGVIRDDVILPSNFIQMRYNRDNMAFGLALSVTPYEHLMKLANECAKGISDPKSNGFSRLFYHLVLRNLVDNFLPKHNNAKDGDTVRLLKAKLESPRIGELYDAYQKDYVEAVAEPKGVNVDAKTRSAGIAAAKKFAGAKFEKAVFTKSTWQTFKEPKWPYRITAYALPIAIITKDGGKRYVQYCTLTKSANGANYFVQAGSDTSKHPIK